MIREDSQSCRICKNTTIKGRVGGERGGGGGGGERGSENKLVFPKGGKGVF